MKTICTRCRKTVFYENSLPEKCPFCGATFLYPEKTEQQINSDTKRLRLPDKLKHISPMPKSRRVFIPIAIFTDLLWIAVGLFISLKFYIFPRWTIDFLPFFGIGLTLFSIFRFIYRAVMGAKLKKFVTKQKITQVDDLIPLLALKTKTDVLVLFKKTVKWGFLIGYGVKDGTKIYQEKITKKEQK
ncbi:MAG: hypothetical protein IKC83_02480 [Clostridia bacterium]|nr:hypothetical protein [Clostridia bacterium]